MDKALEDFLRDSDELLRFAECMRDAIQALFRWRYKELSYPLLAECEKVEHKAFLDELSKEVGTIGIVPSSEVDATVEAFVQKIAQMFGIRVVDLIMLNPERCVFEEGKRLSIELDWELSTLTSMIFELFSC